MISGGEDSIIFHANMTIFFLLKKVVEVSGLITYRFVEVSVKSFTIFPLMLLLIPTAII